VTPTLDHLEKTLADAYRKEIEQEENIWRSLPFFTATLALQMAALFQVLDKVPPWTTWQGVLCAVLLAFAAAATLVALGFMVAAIYPAEFRYVASEPDLVTYATDLDRAEDETPEAEQGGDALAAFKRELARQYAIATHHNRRINQRRARRRSIAGLAALASILATVLLVGGVMTPYVPNGQGTGEHRAPTRTPAAGTPAE
jgi:ferric-dicitrate binding protein FerR (iron transport regulator)